MQSVDERVKKKGHKIMINSGINVDNKKRKIFLIFIYTTIQLFALNEREAKREKEKKSKTSPGMKTTTDRHQMSL